MPKLINRPPNYTLHKPSGQAKVRFNGKTLYLGKHGTRASLEAYAEFVAKLPKPDAPTTFTHPIPGSVLLIGECVLRYEQHARTYYARDGIPTGEHVTIRNALRPLTKRPGEAIAIRAAEIDRADPTCWLCRPGHHKTAHKDKTRVIFIGARAQEIILPYILKATDGPLFPITRAALRRAIQRDCDRLYPHPTITKPTERQLKQMDAQSKEALLAELHAWQRAHQWHPNQLRHPAATDFRSKFGLEAAQVLLGHSKADTTQVYAERDLKKAAKVARKIG